MPRPLRAVCSAGLGAVLASLYLLCPNRDVIPLWGWCLWILAAALAGGTVGLRGATLDRDKFGVLLIVIGSVWVFMVGVFWGQELTFQALKANLTMGAVFLAVFTLLIRLMIRLMRWADRKWSHWK